MYQSRINAYIYRRTSDHELSDDLTAETFAKAIEAVQAGNAHRTSLSGWLFRIAHNLIIDYYRTRDRHKAVSLEDIPQRTTPESQSPPALFEASLLRACMHRAIARLAGAQAEVIQLRLDGYDCEEIGLLLGKTEGAVKAIRHRAWATLRNLLKDDPAVIAHMSQSDAS